MDSADIVIVGSGAATTTTLIELFNRLINEPYIERKINICVVEKYPEFWKGIPYGSRSSVNSLIIAALSDFIPDGREKTRFLDWLVQNRNRWTKYYREKGGLAAAAWLDRNLHWLDENAWDKVYIPRFVYGMYMEGEMLDFLQIVNERNLASVTLIHAEAVDVSAEDGSYRVKLEYTDGRLSEIVAEKLIVAIGSAPVKENVRIQNGNYEYINDLYAPFLDDNLEKLKDKLLNTPKIEDRNVLIIGSNASSIELMYLLDHRPDILEVIHRMTAISQTGKMPYHISERRFDKYPCKTLDQIKKDGNYTIHTLIEAAKEDLKPAVSPEVIIPYVDRVISYVIELMQILDEDSKKMFFGIYGPQLSRLIRRSGPEYKSASNNLLNISKLKLLKGRFINIEAASHGGVLNYTDSKGEVQTYAAPFKVIINCSGSNDLVSSSSRLISNLVHKKICEVNRSGKGFVVNDKFEAAPNLYVMGPLLGGNMNKRIHFWHLESMARLWYLSPFLADILLEKIKSPSVHYKLMKT